MISMVSSRNLALILMLFQNFAVKIDQKVVRGRKSISIRFRNFLKTFREFLKKLLLNKISEKTAGSL